MPSARSIGCYAGAGPTLLVEAFPKHVRCSGLSAGYNLSLSIFGGTVPMVAVFLIAETGNNLSPAWYLAVAAAVAGAMAVIIHSQEETA
jgi:MHS family proline/betaine transporter-like MFS transporter